MDTVALLQSIPFFQRLPRERLVEFLEKSEILKLESGQELIRQGESGRHAFVLLDGRLRASTLGSLGKEFVIGEISRGEILGETAALLEQPRGATLKAIRDSVILQIDRDDLLSILESERESLLEFTRTIVKRARPSFAFQSEIRTILLFPISPGFPVDDFARDLSTALPRSGNCLVVDPSALKEKTGFVFRDDSEESVRTAVPELVKLESDNDITVYKSEGKWDGFTQACARRVDRILLLAESGKFVEKTEAELRLWNEIENANQVRTELVVQHPSETAHPKGTGRWLEDRDIYRHHHLVRGSERDMAMLVRFLTGKSVGLALSGGGFKSSMQAGIMHAMLEAGIPLDILGGSSGGAFAGAVFANRPQIDKIPALVAEGMERFNKVTKLTFPIVSLYTGKRITRGFQDFFGDTDLEDLWTNYFCISLSLVNGDLIVHQRGKLWEAVRASASVMGLFPPVMTKDDVLVDGGFINPCPTDVLHKMGAGKVIVVSAFGKAGIHGKGEFSPSVSGWNLLFKSLNPFYRKKIAPKIGASIVQSMLFASTHLLANVFDKSRIDLFIEPDMSKYSAQDQDAVQKMYEIGYEYGIRRSKEWKGKLDLM